MVPLSLPDALHLHLRDFNSKDYRAKPGFLLPILLRFVATQAVPADSLLRFPYVCALAAEMCRPALCGPPAVEYTLSVANYLSS